MSLAGAPPAGTAIPAIARRLADGDDIEPVWLNQLGGLTFRLGQRFLKYSPSHSLLPEVERLRWAAAFHPVPRVIDHADDGEWMLTESITARSAVDASIPPRVAARALGEGLRALHENLPAETSPYLWSAESRGGVDAPPIERLVVCHGDACLPNTLVDTHGIWVAHVDLGSMGTADRWADLAVGSMSLDWNLGVGWQPEFFAAYGVTRDEERIHYYRRLWNQPG